MQTSEITSLNQLQVELVRNGFGKKVNENPTDEEDIVPSPGQFAVNYITVPVPMDWGFEPKFQLDNFEESLVNFYCDNCLTDLRKK